MIKINRKMEYALMCLKHMGTKAQDELTTARELCDLYQMPFDTVSKVMQQMNNVGICHSLKGVKGGYTLTKQLSEITYMELSEVIEGKSFEMKCETNSGGPCELIKSCNIISPVQKINYHVAGLFKQLTLEELLMKVI
jgi:Rrf2 family protein